MCGGKELGVQISFILQRRSHYISVMVRYATLTSESPHSHSAENFNDYE